MYIHAYIYIYIYLHTYIYILWTSTGNVGIGRMRHDLFKHAERDHGRARRLDPLRQCPPRVHNIRGFRTKSLRRGLGVNGRLRQRVRWEEGRRWQINLEITHRVFDLIHTCVFITPAKFGRNLIDRDSVAQERAVYLHTYANELCHVWKRHGTYERVMVRMNESWHVWMSHGIWLSQDVWMSHSTHQWVITRMNESWHIEWVLTRRNTYYIFFPKMSHGTYEWVKNESCLRWMSHDTCGWVMPRMDESCHVWTRSTTMN